MRRLATVTGALLAVALLPMVTGDRAAASFDATALGEEIPQMMLDAYLAAGKANDLDWALVAAIGKLECDHGRYQADGCNPPGTVNFAGARGPMQFLGSTWTGRPSDRHRVDVAGPPGGGAGVDADGDGVADPWSVPDAVHAAARFLVALGGRDDPRRAARAYNAGPANPDPLAGEGYASQAMALVAEYHALAGPAGPGVATGEVTDGFALPFERQGLLDAARGRDPEWLLTKPHHSGRIAADIPLVVGTPLYALTDGTVSYAGLAGNCGLTIKLQLTGHATTATHCHLSQLDIATGDAVEAGDLIGRSGGRPGHFGAGSSTGPHLHLHLTRADGRRCPQGLLLALWLAAPAPTPAALAYQGCA